MTNQKLMQTLLSICLVMMLLSGFLLPGCKEKETLPGAPVTYTVGVTLGPQSKNPFVAGSSGQYVYLTQVYEPLVVTTTTYSSIIPVLAKSWEYDTTTKTWTFHLDEKAKFSDGTAVKASDVKYSWETMFANSILPQPAKTMVKSINVADDKTVKFILNDSYAEFLNEAGLYLIVPAYIWSTVGDAVKYSNDNAIGSGPYLWTELSANSYATFKSNPNYWRGASKIDELIVKVYGTEENETLALRKGEIQAMYDITVTSSVPSMLMDLSMKINLVPSTSTDTLYFNLRLEPFNILEFRQAINMVINRRNYIDIGLNGYGVIPQQTAIPPFQNDCNPAVKWPYEFKTQQERIDMANAKLDAIPGMTAKGTDGIRSYNGNKLNFEFSHDVIAATVTKAGLVIADVKNIGIQFTSKPVPFATLNTIVNRNNGTNPLSWQVYFGVVVKFYDSWVLPAPAPLAQGGVWNNPLQTSEAVGWTNTTIQPMIKQQSTMSDPKARLTLQYTIQELFAAQMPTVILAHRTKVVGYRIDKFTGWIINTGVYDGWAIFYGPGVPVPYAFTTFNLLNLQAITQ